ncbi:hypothetical protein ACIQ7D_05665 [Streptomyces sp. NPDC096310]|uniref:hypothetical protein n=1 Tax=Streptomyces sp. NPDC096310 TaxID=3366082 RepID=UPI003820629F
MTAVLGDLLWAPTVPPATEAGTGAGTNPLRETDALQEAQLLDLRWHALSSTLGLLFELRTAMQFDVGTAAVLMVRGARECAWDASPAQSPLTAWNVVGSEPSRAAGSFGMTLSFYPRAGLRLAGESAEFYVVDVPGLGDTPPDYVEAASDISNLGQRLPSWASPFSPLWSASLHG